MSQSNKSFLEKLYAVLPELIKKDVISDETANKIKTHFGPIQKTEKVNLSIIIFGILGTLLVSGGIILPDFVIFS